MPGVWWDRAGEVEADSTRICRICRAVWITISEQGKSMQGS